MAKRTRTIQWTEEISFIRSLTVSAGVIGILDQLYLLDRATTIRTKHMSAACGITDDPTDEEIIWVLMQTDPDSIPDGFQGWVDSSIWNKPVSWRSIGTDAGPTEVFSDKEETDLDSLHSIVESDEPAGIVLMVRSSTTSATRIIGTLTILIMYRQATYNNSKAPASELELMTLWFS